MIGAVASAGCGPAGAPDRATGSIPPSSRPHSSTSGAIATQLETPTSPRTSPHTSRTASPAEPPGSVSAGTCIETHCYTVGSTIELPDGVTPEASGLAASSTRNGVYFVVDDGSGVSSISAVDSAGAVVAKIGVTGMDVQNGEALAAGPCGDRPGRCLYIGDIGDNSAKRGAIVIYRIAEPSLSPPPVGAVPAAQWQYRYPQGPQDAESLLVTESGSVLVITKSAPGAGGVVPPHRIYRGKPGGGVLEPVGDFTPPNPENRRQSLFTGTVVTDATYARGRLLLLTYDEVIEYLAPKPGADVGHFPSWPHHSLPAPELVQSEGIALNPTGCGYAVASEEGPGGHRAGLATVACR